MLAILVGSRKLLNHCGSDLPPVSSASLGGRVQKLGVGYSLTVHRVQGEWLWTNDYYRGWVHASDVILQSEALEYFNKMLGRFPCSILHLYRANARAFANEEYETVLEDIDTAIRLDPDNYLAYLSRLDWSDKYENDQQSYEALLADCQTVLELNPQASKAHYYRGLL